ncbi:tigger transposable element-derived protein 6 [Trichonephila clavipes]|nr:tigger transposable element-derived protein 6 [Trichonephila clavipes]
MRGLAARLLFRVPPCRNGTIHLETSMLLRDSSPVPTAPQRRHATVVKFKRQEEGAMICKLLAFQHIQTKQAPVATPTMCLDEKIVQPVYHTQIAFERFCLHQDGHIIVWRYGGERTLAVCIRHRHSSPIPSSVMVWGAIEYTSQSPLLSTDGLLNNVHDISGVLRLVALPFIRALRKPTFQQGNARPPHMVEVLCGPSLIRKINGCCPDLSPIEINYSMVDERLTRHHTPVITFDELWHRVAASWPSVTVHDIQSLFNLMPRRISVVITDRAKGDRIVEEGERKVDVAKAFEIPLSSLSTILRNKEKIFNASLSGVRKRVSKGNFPRLEKCLVSWMRQCRGQNIPMGGSLLKEKAKSFAKELGIEFSVSEGWLTNFKKRNGIVFKKMCGESSSVDINVCSKWQNSLSDLIKEYKPRNYFNMEETGLFFKCLPEKKTFTFKKEKCDGGKHSKERLIILRAVNMGGSEKITPLIIEKSVEPRCFKGINSFPTKYRSNKKAWRTTELFNQWLVSLNSDMKREKRHILLFLDNCTMHNNAQPL